jgi:hypothetical protein
MEPINAFDRPISVTASQRLKYGVSPNPNPRSVEVGDILLWQGQSQVKAKGKDTTAVLDLHRGLTRCLSPWFWGELVINREASLSGRKG